MTIPPCSRLCTACARRTGSSYSPQITHCPKCGPLVGGKEFHSFGVAAGFGDVDAGGRALERLDRCSPRRASPAGRTRSSTRPRRAGRTRRRRRRPRGRARRRGSARGRAGHAAPSASSGPVRAAAERGVRAFLAKVAAMVAARLRPTGSLPFVGRDPGLVRTRARASAAPQPGSCCAHASSTAESAIELERRAAEEKLTAADRARADLEQQFSALSADALRQNNSAFLELAESKLQGYVGPLKESLEKVDGHVRSLEQARQHAYGALRQELGALRDGQEKLRRDGKPRRGPARAARPRALGRDAAEARRARWRGCSSTAIRRAGVVRDGEGALLRPDLIVKLPGGKNVVVDAKAPLDAYLDAFEAEERGRARDRARHARAPGARPHDASSRRRRTGGSSRPRPSSWSCSSPTRRSSAIALEQDAAADRGRRGRPA